MIKESMIALGLCIFLVGLGWLAHFAISIKSYILSAITMGAGVLVALTASAPWRDITCTVRRYFRRH